MIAHAASALLTGDARTALSSQSDLRRLGDQRCVLGRARMALDAPGIGDRLGDIGIGAAVENRAQQRIYAAVWAEKQSFVQLTGRRCS